MNASDLAPALEALGARIKTTKRTLAAEEFFTAGKLRSTVLARGELVEEILVPAQRPGSRQAYQKFRIRNSIDFPIAGLAVIFSAAGGKISEARLVLSAVAPIPFRLKAVEEFLRERVGDIRKHIREFIAAEIMEVTPQKITINIFWDIDSINYSKTIWLVSR